MLLSQMTYDDVTAMFAPKLDAAALLHRLSVTTPVRHFVLFSSISGLTGSRWLAHYTATSGYLDALAYARRVMGCRPPSSIGACGSPWLTPNIRPARSVSDPGCCPWTTRSPSARCRWCSTR
ncbi:short chain dehydrogenase family protein, partial [Mycobacterium kansasii 662]